METITAKWQMSIESGNWWGNYTTRGGRMARNSRAKQHRDTAWMLVTAAIRERGQGTTTIDSAIVHIRVRRPRLLDSDNLIWGCKHLRDGIACALAGLPPAKNAPDGPNDPYEWKCSQSKGKDQITVEVTSR